MEGAARCLANNFGALGPPPGVAAAVAKPRYPNPYPIGCGVDVGDMLIGGEGLPGVFFTQPSHPHL